MKSTLSNKSFRIWKWKTKIFKHKLKDKKTLSNKKKERWFVTYEEDMPMEDYEKTTCEYIGRVGTVPELYVFEVHD